MKSIQDQKYSEQVLQNKGIKLHEITEFCFMKPYQTPKYKSHIGSKVKYGAGILTLYIRGNHEKAFSLKPSQHPERIIRYLLASGITFKNYHPRERTIDSLPEKTYKRASLYMFYFFVLFLTFIILAFWSLTLVSEWKFIPGLLSFSAALYFLNMLLTRFCYLSTSEKGLTIFSVGRVISHPYEDIIKVNFDFAREQNFTHIMEFLDKEYNYHLYYIGRVSRKDLDEIAALLRNAGIDATCSLDHEKRFYQDSIH